EDAWTPLEGCAESQSVRADGTSAGTSIRTMILESSDASNSRARPIARHQRNRIQTDRANPRPCPELSRARNLLGHVVGALLVQIEPRASAQLSDEWAARRAGAGRERRRDRHRRRVGG